MAIKSIKEILKCEVKNDQDELMVVFRINPSDIELNAGWNGLEMMMNIRREIGKAVADRIMEKAGPGIDKAIAEAFKLPGD